MVGCNGCLGEAFVALNPDPEPLYVFMTNFWTNLESKLS